MTTRTRAVLRTKTLAVVMSLVFVVELLRSLGVVYVYLISNAELK